MTQPGDIITLPEHELRIWRRWFFMLLGRPVPVVRKPYTVTHTTANDWSACVECGDPIREPITRAQIDTAASIALSAASASFAFGLYISAVIQGDAGHAMLWLLLSLSNAWWIPELRR